MSRASVLLVVVAAMTAAISAQEVKPVPKNSMRVSIPGCTKGYVLTAGPRTEAQPGSADVPEGMHLRMNGPKKMLSDLRAHEGSVVIVTGLVRKGQRRPDGVGIGGIRITPGPPPNGGVAVGTVSEQIMIDVEGWRPGVGDCPAR